MNSAIKRLVCAVLAVSTILAPWGSGLLPEPLGTIGTKPAAALAYTASVEDGFPEPCPTTPVQWTAVPTADGPECQLRLPACPESLLFPGTGNFWLMSSPQSGLDAEFPILGLGQPPTDPPIDTYPEFCEERALDLPPTDTAYDTCVNMTGVTVKSYVDGGVDGCRLLRPLQCPAGMYHVTTQICEGLIRRTWSCQMPTDIRRNEFNTCYRDSSVIPPTTPWCEAGAPTFAIATCEEYAGNDVVSTPLDCTTEFPTDTPVLDSDGFQAVTGAMRIELEIALVGGMTNLYWCQYDARYLSDDCHRTDVGPTPDCMEPIISLCLQRASRTGGCDTVAHNIRCNAYEAAWRQSGLSAREVRQDGCAPCDVPPFSTVGEASFDDSHREDMDSCPRDAIGPPYVGRTYVAGSGTSTGRPVTAENPSVALAHNHQNGRGPCANAPSGTLTWHSNHSSGLAVVNSGVTVLTRGINLRRYGRSIHEYVPNIENLRTGEAPIDFDADQRIWVYRQDTADDPVVRLRPEINLSSAEAYGTIDEMMVDLGGECEVRSDPTFRLIVRELWPDNGPEYVDNNPACDITSLASDPDNDAELIVHLLGNDALAWWCDLSLDQRKALSIAKGYGWWHDLDDDAKKARAHSSSETVYCDFSLGPGAWCRWKPSRSGFYALHIGGAWPLVRYAAKFDVTNGRFGTVLDYLNDPVAGPSNYSVLNTNLSSITGNLFSPRQLQDLGIQVDDITGAFTPVPIAGTDLDWYYSSDSYPNNNCAAIDLRIRCNTLGDTDISYSTSQRIGVMVHEARVVTRNPS